MQTGGWGQMGWLEKLEAHASPHALGAQVNGSFLKQPKEYLDLGPLGKRCRLFDRRFCL